MKILVTGGAGFISGHLVGRLLYEGHEVRAVDIKPLEEWWQIWPASQVKACCDLRLKHNCEHACEGMDQVYNLAASMGGIGYISRFHAICMENVLINTHMLDAAANNRIKRYLFSSSACVYNADFQNTPDIAGLREEDAYPALAERAYGEEKLFSERACEEFRKERGLETRIPRFHNVTGPFGDWRGGKEKAPAAACRKIAEAKDGDTIEIWGDGNQTRSFMHVEDCVEGLIRLMASDYNEPVNLGREEMVTINELYQMVADIAGKSVTFKHNLDKPQGVRGRNSDNSVLRKVLNWEPQISLRDSLQKTYPWIENEVRKKRDQS